MYIDTFSIQLIKINFSTSKPFTYKSKRFITLFYLKYKVNIILTLNMHGFYLCSIKLIANGKMIVWNNILTIHFVLMYS